MYQFAMERCTEVPIRQLHNLSLNFRVRMCFWCLHIAVVFLCRFKCVSYLCEKEDKAGGERMMCDRNSELKALPSLAIKDNEQKDYVYVIIIRIC